MNKKTSNHKKYLLVAVDVDGTLIENEMTISPRVMETVRMARRNGTEFTLATGRAHFSAVRFAKQLDLTAPLITFGGGMIQDPSNGKIYFRKALYPEIAKKAYELLSSIGLHVHIHNDEGVHASEERDEIRIYHSITNNPVKITDIKPLLDKGPMKLLAISDDLDLLKKGELLLMDKMPDSISIARSLPNFVEVVDINVSKGTALEWLARHLNIKREEVIAIGDSYNDISMIRYAGLGIATAQSPEELKYHANAICPGPENDGVAWVLENFILNNYAEKQKR